MTSSNLHLSSSMSKDNMEKQLRSRRERKGAQGGRKVKTGCRTCRVRHKKCDEHRPACSQCMRSGWKCDLSVAPFISQAPQQHPQPPSSAVWGTTTLDPLDVWNFEYFRIVCARRISLYLRSDLWETLILQAVSTEQCILNAAVAVGALSRNMVPSKHLPHPGFLPGHPAGYSLQKYNLAVGQLRRELQSRPQSVEIALLGSLIFVVFEMENGNVKQVEMHRESALQIVHEAETARILSNPLARQLAQALDAFSKIDLQSSVISCHRLYMSLPAIPTFFDTIDKARDFLNAINGDLNSIFHKWSCASKSERDRAFLTGWSQDVATILSHLQCWQMALDKSKERLSLETTSASCALILRMTFEVIWISASTFTSSKETAYDSHLFRFLNIVQVAEQLLKSNDTNTVAKLRSASRPQFDVAVVQPLFFVASKCRHGLTRRQAIRLLAKTQMSDLYDTQLQLKAACWIMAKEETNVRSGECSRFVSEEDRLHDLRLDVDPSLKLCRVSGWKLRNDGHFYGISHTISSKN